MNILLTGGAGYIGSHVVFSLLDNGHKVTVIDNLSTGHKKILPKKINFFDCNINEKYKIKEILQSSNFDILMHFAGFIKVEESVSNPKKYFENNTDNAISLFETCLENNLNNIIFSSTAAVYGNPKENKPISENELLKPLNPYGESKMRTENYLLKNKKKINSIILRYFNVAGADNQLRTGLLSDAATHLIKIISEVAVGKRKKICIYGNDYTTTDGTAIRDYIHVSDLADIHVKTSEYLLQNRESNIFNCGYGRGYSVLDVINKANNITNGKIKFEISNRRPGDAEKLVSDVEKINKHLKWKPKYNNLKTIIHSSINWEKKIYEENL
ncbi:UDP-glucose 4-epimerase GalE [Pelagibacterales bacterium SAG-MED31]|nr:UDP-glucose 4-epimerase GalE [Pelagibacterales bacterium SAG-MED31]